MWSNGDWSKLNESQLARTFLHSQHVGVLLIIILNGIFASVFVILLAKHRYFSFVIIWDFRDNWKEQFSSQTTLSSYLMLNSH